ncbi:hypothetical protein [Aliterella atlantica]|uniref:Uncharacterized protein n=1 Tax=Aliterella atlantica CENA595 TaxID=1618023 RepID=A0A0D9A1Q0_9CYAN|nr:hypothetical protein [Aliterella atlantica]KJH73386.1 hypothetical protein UH38_00985 [Aliterella atlantica CENA595]
MISTLQPQSKYVHPLARFVSEEAIALILKVPVEKIREIRCWARVILVVGQGLSRFVSYADLPPVVGVEAPTRQDFTYWSKRWRKLKIKHAPDFWATFYANRFGQCRDIAELFNWGQLLGTIKLLLSEQIIIALRSIYVEEKSYLETQLYLCASKSELR